MKNCKRHGPGRDPYCVDCLKDSMIVNDDMKTPTPGSDEAVKQGCTCPVLDNSHGYGYMGRKGIFVYMGGCPVHDIVDDKSEEDEHGD